MQPMYRPSMRPQGMRPPGIPPQGPPSGLPPPQRPPAGYKPNLPAAYAQPGPPPGVPATMAPPMMKPPFNPPVQKLADMSLNSSPAASQQSLSNGVPDYSNSSPSQISQVATNGDQTISTMANSSDQLTEASFKCQSNFPAAHPENDAAPFDSLQQRFRRDSPQGEALPPGQSPIPNKGIPSSPPEMNSFSSGPPLNQNSVENKSFPPHSSELSSGLGPSVSTAMHPPQFGKPPTNSTHTSTAVGAMNRPFSPIQSSVVTSTPQMISSQPGMQSPSSSMSPLGSHFGPPRPSVPPSLGGSSEHMMPSSSSMGPPGHMTPSSSSLGPPGHMTPSSSSMGPPGHMTPSSSSMGPPGHMTPSSSSMGPPGHMTPSSSSMGPPGHMTPSSSSMGPPGHMTPSSSSMGPPGHMTPSSSSMGPPGHMTPSSSGVPPGPMMPSSSGAPPGHMPPLASGPPRSMMPPSSGGPPRPMMTPSSTSGPPGPTMPPTSSFGGMPPVSSSPMGVGMPHTLPSPISPSGNAMFPPSFGSRMMTPQQGIQPPRPGMPPPPTSSYLPSPGSSLPPPPSAQPPPVAQPGMPPAPGGMNQQSPSAIGSMQNRYPGSSPGGGPMGSYSQGSQGRRLNPDDMPSPLQVIEEDRHCKSGEFLTNMKGAVPPLVTTDFVVKDGGNASPRFIRSTMYSVPATPDMMKQASVPFGLIISPLADPHPGESVLYQGTSLANGPVRCNRCKAYMSPFMMFMDGGRRFQCLLCKQINEVPADYYCHMDGQGCRADKYQRPELCLGSYEFVATAEYCKDKLLPKEPAFIFVLEMSQMMVQRGIINLICQNMKSLLQHLPRDEIPGQEVTRSSIRVGFITYDSSVHFYKLTGLAPEMCIVCDKETMFVPVPDGVLCDVEEVADNIDKLMESIPQNFQTTRETSGALSCAIQAGMSALKASGRAGKLFVFHSSLPQVEGLGKLRNREDRKVLGTEKEKSVLAPQTNHYNNLAQDLVGVGCGVDLYLFNESYIDLATIGQVCRLTGGQCHKYTFFQPNKDGERLLDDLRINISRNIAFESVMRVRTSTGVRPVDFFGHFFMSNTHDIEIAAVESNKAVAVEIKHDDKITDEDGVYIQVALLYTSCGGQRRLRIINLSLNICTQMADLYKNCELDTLMNFFGKQSMFKFLVSSAKQVKDNLIARTAQILACYRKNCASPSSAGQLILPELMKLLPLYMNCLTKCDALSGGQDLTCDDRSWHIYQLSTMPVEASVVYYYPRLIPLSDDDQQQDDTDIPSPIRTSYEKLSPDGAYLLENGLFMFMWVGSGTSSKWMKDVFGVSAPHQLDPVLAELPEFDTPASKRVRNIINAIREQRKLHVRLFVVPQQGKHEIVMRNYLVEDKGMFGAPSYVDFLCHVHKEIRALLS